MESPAAASHSMCFFCKGPHKHSDDCKHPGEMDSVTLNVQFVTIGCSLYFLHGYLQSAASRENRPEAKEHGEKSEGREATEECEERAESKD